MKAGIRVTIPYGADVFIGCLSRMSGRPCLLQKRLNGHCDRLWGVVISSYNVMGEWLDGRERCKTWDCPAR